LKSKIVQKKIERIVRNFDYAPSSRLGNPT
jgi:hypothetical protein